MKTTTLAELLAEETPEFREAVRKEADAMRMEMSLSRIRQLADLTQAELADAMGVKQPTIANLERTNNDARLSSIKRYVEALGGHMSLTVELPDGSTHGFRI
ncbi:helix-turn-helix domain-containing protein [Kushneria aurantia]|uniref:Helix-turn-helix domain-containing protein n=1 Tax=Kushneria aurantia TaxID=504092 RepID=A0ABV6G6N5_9GAMM|nr:helix-turn-helix domain-containing protein [Kushneria aurantia]